MKQVKDDFLVSIEEKYSFWLKMKQITALVLKWKIITEQKKEMMPSRSKKVSDFSDNNLKLLMLGCCKKQRNVL